jgi:hypothetical protein
MTQKDYLKVRLDFPKLLMGSVVGTLIVLARTTRPNHVAEFVGFIIILVSFIILSREYNNCMNE